MAPARQLLLLLLLHATDAIFLAGDADEQRTFCEHCLDDDEDGAVSLLQRQLRKASASDSAEVQHVLLKCEGEGFFDCFNFYDREDPTMGFVNYVPRAEAMRFNLLGNSFHGTKAVTLATFTGIGMPAKTLRLESQQFNQGLFVMDVVHVPTGLGTWPSFWLHGDNWPEDGELDIFEAVNTGNESKTSIHASAGCAMPNVPGIDNGGAAMGKDGAGVWGLPAGEALNDAGGGYFATWWSVRGFAVYFFPRAGPAPPDISSDAPDPRKWPRPWRFFPFSAECPAAHFKDMRLTLNTAFCGEWAGRDFPGGWDACKEHVSATVNQEAFWAINSVKVFTVDITPDWEPPGDWLPDTTSIAPQAAASVLAPLAAEPKMQQTRNEGQNPFNAAAAWGGRVLDSMWGFIRSLAPQ